MTETQASGGVGGTGRRAPRSILCVDADDDSRLFAAELLYEYDVDFALTGEDAVQLAHSRAYDLYLVDPDVPGCERVDLLQDLRLYDKGVPIVLCMSAGRLAAAEDVAEACLRKPYNGAELRAVVERLVDDGAAPVGNVTRP